MTAPKRYVSKVIEDPETKELVFIIPDELMSELGLVEGMYLQWCIESNGDIILKKSNIVDTKGQK